MEELGEQKFTARCQALLTLELSESECMKEIRRLLSYLPSNWKEKPPHRDVKDSPERPSENLENIVPVQPAKGYDMHLVIKDIADEGDFLEIKPEFASEIIVGFARLEGNTVGIVANQPKVRAGCMSVDSADKQARFIRFCDAFNIPIVLLVDTPGYCQAKTRNIQESSGTVQRCLCLV